MYNTKSKPYVFVCMHTHTQIAGSIPKASEAPPTPPTPVFTPCASVSIVPMTCLQVFFSFLLLLFFLICHWKILKMLSLTSSSLSTCPPIFLPNNTLRPVSSGLLRAKSFASPSLPPILSCPVSGNLSFIKDLNDNSCPRNWDHAWWVSSLIFFFYFSIFTDQEPLLEINTSWLCSISCTFQVTFMWNKFGKLQAHFSKVALSKLSVSIPVGGFFLLCQGNLPSAVWRREFHWSHFCQGFVSSCLSTAPTHTHTHTQTIYQF